MIKKSDWIRVKHKLSEAEVEAVEKQWDIILPEDYKDMIREINGGALKEAFLIVDNYGKIPYARNVDLSIRAKCSIYSLMDVINENGKRLFPFGSVGNGDYFCFDISAQCVVLWMHETSKKVYICGSFKELLDIITVK